MSPDVLCGVFCCGVCGATECDIDEIATDVASPSLHSLLVLACVMLVQKFDWTMLTLTRSFLVLAVTSVMAVSPVGGAPLSLVVRATLSLDSLFFSSTVSIFPLLLVAKPLS